MRWRIGEVYDKVVVYDVVVYDNVVVFDDVEGQVRSCAGRGMLRDM